MKMNLINLKVSAPLCTDIATPIHKILDNHFDNNLQYFYRQLFIKYYNVFHENNSAFQTTKNCIPLTQSATFIDSSTFSKC